MTEKILATVVTFNRKDLLIECVEALKTTEYACDILIVDNASTDGTKETIDYLVDNEHVFYQNTGVNLGGAGGFNFALRQGVELGYDYIWIMDDDTMVHSDSLTELMRAADKLNGHFGFLSSYVQFTDGTPCLMNVPGLVKDSWYEGLAVDTDILKINRATFVSTLVPSKVILEKGLPIKEFFIWSDDTEYTKRIAKDLPAYFVTKSVVTHKMNANTNTDLKTFFVKGNSERINRFFYTFRNTYYLRKKAGIVPTLRYTTKIFYIFFLTLFKAKEYKFKKLGILLKGLWAGIFFNPSIEYVQKD